MNNDNILIMKFIIHMDLDAFYVSAEITRKPQLANKPIVIGKNVSKSVISSASYEARKLGINSGMPIFMAKKILPNLIIINPNFDLYSQLSNRVFQLISTFSKNIEIISIDECYIKREVEFKDLNEAINWCQKIQKLIFQNLKLYSSFGIGFTKFTAKMATDLNKPLGISHLINEDIKNVMHNLPIEKFYGIGKSTIPKLIEKNIKFIGDLAKYKATDLITIFKNKTQTILDNANGIGDSNIIIEPRIIKSISKDKTFLYDVTNDRNELVNNIKLLSSQISKKLKKINYMALIVSIKIIYKNNKNISKNIKIGNPSFNANVISSNAINLFDNLWNGQNIKKISVSAYNFVSTNNAFIQSSIFDSSQKVNRSKNIINKVNAKIGKRKLILASDLLE